MTNPDYVLVRPEDLNRLVGFVKCLDSTFSELNALFSVIAGKEEHHHTQTEALANLGSIHTSNWRDYCVEEEELLNRLQLQINQAWEVKNAQK